MPKQGFDAAQAIDYAQATYLQHHQLVGGGEALKVIGRCGGDRGAICGGTDAVRSRRHIDGTCGDRLNAQQSHGTYGLRRDE